MDDLTLVKLCHDAMGDLPAIIQHDGEWRFGYKGCYGPPYDPLRDDAQCFALVKRFKLSIYGSVMDEGWEVDAEKLREPANKEYPVQPIGNAMDNDLNRAVCTLVATLQASKRGG